MNVCVSMFVLIECIFQGRNSSMSFCSMREKYENTERRRRRRRRKLAIKSAAAAVVVICVFVIVFIRRQTSKSV